MHYPTTPDALRRRRLIVLSVGVALVSIAVIGYALLLNRSASTTSGPASRHPDRPTPEATKLHSPAAGLPALPPTSEPEAFARLVSQALFGWDTTRMMSRTDHIEQLIAVADPTGESTPGLVSDLDNYLPTPGAWLELAQYETAQWLSIESVTTPSKWAEAQSQAGDELLPGTTALTIRGTRHRSGVWETAPVTSAHDVAFTVFIVCGPSYPRCHLLRLSMLDKPLE